MTVRTDGDLSTVVVSDDGPGIDADHIDRVFDRFWRRDAARTRSTGGAGLGFAIVAALVDAHGGTVTAATRPEGGASFSIGRPCWGDPAKRHAV